MFCSGPALSGNTRRPNPGDATGDLRNGFLCPDELTSARKRQSAIAVCTRRHVGSRSARTSSHVNRYAACASRRAGSCQLSSAITSSRTVATKIASSTDHSNRCARHTTTASSNVRKREATRSAPRWMAGRSIRNIRGTGHSASLSAFIHRAVDGHEPSWKRIQAATSGIPKGILTGRGRSNL